METPKFAEKNVDNVRKEVKNKSLERVLETNLETKLEKKPVGNNSGLDELMAFLVSNFWLLACLLLLLTIGLVGFFLYRNFPQVKNIVSDITGQNTPSNSIKGLIKSYRDKNLIAVEKYADLDKIVDSVVDSLVEDLKDDKRYSTLFGTDDVKVLLNEKLEAVRTKYKEQIRKSIISGEIDVNWSEVGRVFLDDSFDEALKSGNLTVNGNQAQFEITTSKGVLIVKMMKVQSLWKVQSIVAKDDWKGFLGN